MVAAGLSVTETIAFIDEVPKQSQAKTLLRRRLQQHERLYHRIANTTSPKGRKKAAYRNSILSNLLEIPSTVPELKYCLEAFRSLTETEIAEHKDYVLDRLFQIYSDYFNNGYYKDIAQWFRYAVCWIDEALNMNVYTSR